MSNKNFSSTKKIAFSGLVIALYTVIMYFTQGFSFGQYQIRLATAMYSLSAITPVLIVPLGLANLISNTIMGGMGIYDIIGGCLVGIITSSIVYAIKRLGMNDWFIILPIILGPGLLVPIWLSFTLNVPYTVLAISLCIGQIIPAILGVILLKQLKDKI
ncbi:MULTISPECIES: QueT transporter family protein [Clostridium]|uniref:QueT transporter family protein n=1 Tax=Clostridium TaxID=1485 RepID=UPI00069DF80D|nr:MULTISPECIES: QueT transporter family protein [Clostridium]KOF56062.1 hypothetical protein AGR56_03630 [Clostridium sp. DMHC 10]MCD2345556.1 QueT transporter family protein [Clostridium guangxiense]